MKADPARVLTGAHYLDGNHAAAEGAIAAGCRFTDSAPRPMPEPNAAGVRPWPVRDALEPRNSLRR